MDFCEKQSMQGDCLWLTAFLFRKMFKFKRIRLCFLVAIATQLCIYLFEFYVFSTHPEYFMKYAPWLFARTYGFVVAIAVLLKRYSVEEILDDFHKWDLNSTGDECQKESQRTIFLSNSMTITVLSLGAVMCLFYFQNNRSDVEYYLVMFIVEKHWPEFSSFFNFAIKFLLVPLYFAMLVHVFIMAYAVQHFLMQLHMWIVNFERIFDDYPGEDDEIVDDGKYQEEICRRLVFSIQRIVYFLQFKRLLDKKLVRPLFVLHLCSFSISVISIILLMYESYQGAYQNYGINNKILCWMFLVIIWVVYCYLLHYGQEIENASENVYRAVAQLKSYNLDQHNRLTVLMFWLIMMRPIRVEFLSNLAVNYALGLRMARGLYSVISLIIVRLHRS